MEVNEYNEILYELAECRQDERDSQNQILQTLATAASALTIIWGVSIFGELKDFSDITKKGIYILCVVVLLAAVSYVISLGITNSIRFHYIRQLEDSLLNEKNNNNIVHWMSFIASINTKNIKHIFNSKYTTVSFLVYSLAIIFAILFCLGLTMIEYFVFNFSDPILLIIPIFLIFCAILLYVLSTVFAEKMYRFSYKHSFYQRKKRIIKMNNGISTIFQEKNRGNRFVKGLLYFIYPAVKDFHKLFLIIYGYLMGLLFINQYKINISTVKDSFFKIGVVVIIIEGLIYQARYQFNDIRGLKDDIKTHSVFNKSGKYLVECSDKRSLVLLSLFLIIIKMALAFLLIIKIGGKMKMPLLICSNLIIFITIFYEISRSMKWDIPVIIFVSLGYLLRILAGLWCAIPNLFENNTLLIELGYSQMNIWLLLLSFAAMGGFSVTISWIYEAFYQKRSGEIVKHHYRYLFESFEERFDKYLQNNDNGFYPLIEKGKLSDWWNFYFLCSILLCSLNIVILNEHNVICYVYECVLVFLVIRLCVSSYNEITFLLVILLICGVSKFIVTILLIELEIVIATVVLYIHQFLFIILYYYLRCRFNPHFNFFKSIFLIFIGKDTFDIISSSYSKNKK